LPWESREELMRQADKIAQLPLSTLKLHQLQIIRGTALGQEYQQHPWSLPTAEEYIDLVLEYIAHLPASLVLERFVSQSPPKYVIAPQWGLKNYEFTNLVKQKMKKI
jgi:radical SAM superfamily enzyme